MGETKVFSCSCCISPRDCQCEGQKSKSSLKKATNLLCQYQSGRKQPQISYSKTNMIQTLYCQNYFLLYSAPNTCSCAGRCFTNPTSKTAHHFIVHFIYSFLHNNCKNVDEVYIPKTLLRKGTANTTILLLFSQHFVVKRTECKVSCANRSAIYGD